MVSVGALAHAKPQASGQRDSPADSIVVNIAEGRMRSGKAGKNHYRIAHGSAGEALSVLDIVSVPGALEQQEKLRRIGVMLSRMR